MPTRTRYIFAAFTIAAALAVALPASAYYSNSSYSTYTANPGTNFDPAGHYVYDINGVARWSGSGANNSYRSSHRVSCITSQNAGGRIRYDSNGVAYWDGGSSTTTCR